MKNKGHIPAIAANKAAAARRGGAGGHGVRVRDRFQLTAKEGRRFLRIISKAARIRRHYDLFRLLQEDVQRLVPHQILICAWGDFYGADLRFDVISAIPGVRTGRVGGCNIQD